MKTKTIALLLLLGATCASAQIALPPFTFYGTLTDWRNIPFAARDEVTVYARKTNTSVLVAQARVFNVLPRPNRQNYRLTIPMSNSTNVPGAACVGEKLHFTVDDGVTLWNDQRMMPTNLVGNPSTFVRADFGLFLDLNNSGMSDDYEALMRALTDDYDMGIFDPDADYDNDGASNREEYEAGTDPFDPNDYPLDGNTTAFRPNLEVTRIQVTNQVIASVTSKVACISFKPTLDPEMKTLYMVRSSTDMLISPIDWPTIEFTVNSPTAQKRNQLNPTQGNLDDDGVCRFFIPFNGSTGFYRLDVSALDP